MKFVRANHEEPGVNLTPLIDVVFLLLIFFMVSTRFVDDRELPLELPPAANAQSAAAGEVIAVRVGADGAYRVAGESVGAGTLVASLRAQRAQYPQRALRVRADGDARHGAVVRVLDAAATVGFDRVDIATRSED